MSEAIPFLKGASVGHGDKVLLEGVDFKLHPGTITRLVGANGVGKTTLIDSALGLIPLRHGTWAYPHNPGSKQYQEEIGYMPSTIAGYPNLVLQNWLALISSGFSLPTEEVTALWEELGGRGRQKELIANLSSGNRKKALFLPVVARPRRVLFLDEPFEEVDLYGQEVMARLIKEQVEAGAAALIVSHRSVDHLLPIDTTWEINDGHLREAS